MTESERDIMRNERIGQILISLSQKAGIMKAVEKRFGSEGLEVIREEIGRDIAQWIESVLVDQRRKGMRNDIDGLHAFLWENNKDENITFRFEDHENERTYIVTNCPIAEFAKSNGIERYAKYFFCDIYRTIVGKYNEKMTIDLKRTMMDGHNVCELSYRWQP